MLLYFLGALKAAIIALCVLAGVDLIASGFGVQLTSLEYKGLKAMGIPIGIVAMLVGVLVAKYWHISQTVTSTFETYNTEESGNSNASSRETFSTKTTFGDKEERRDRDLS